MPTVLLPPVDVDQLESDRRNTLTQRLALIFAAIVALFVVLTLTVAELEPYLLLTELPTLAFFTLVAWAAAARRSRYAPELLVVGTLLHGLIGTVQTGGVTGLGPTVFFVALVLAGMLVGWQANLFFGASAVTAIVGLAVLNHQGVLVSTIPAPPAMINTYAIVYALLLGAVCVISCVNARSHERALRQMGDQAVAVAAQNDQLRSQGALVQEQSAALEQHRARLEHEVGERTAALEAALAELRQSAVALRELQSPLVPVADGVLVMPLVGAFDRDRAVLFVEDLLCGIEQRRAHTVLLDLTGLPALDRLAAQTLVQSSQAARLLGATIRLVGVTPPVAQTIVGLGLDLGPLRFERDLQSAMVGVVRQDGPLIEQRTNVAVRPLAMSSAR